jgi:energy-coupling factor transporter ATP-binding protein EcfA2
VASFGRNNAKASSKASGKRATIRGEPGIAMLGATGSGKSTFLGALQIALLKQHREWRIWCRDPASRRALVEMNTALTSEGRFPLTTMGIDIFDWILSGKVERTERSGRFNSRSFEETVELALKLTDPTG